MKLVRKVHQNGPRWLEDGLAWLKQREIVEMVSAIATSGSQMRPGEGWFHPGKSRYDFKWLAARYDANKDKKISRQEFAGPPELFDRLDRNHDGFIAADDFDWSVRSSYVQQGTYARYLFFRLDADSTGRVTRQDWDNWFKKLSKGKDYLTADDLRDLMQQPAPSKGDKEDEGPTRATLLKGLMAGELGSIHEGPKIGQRAPPFKLPTHDGKKEFSLGQFRGQKPVVLIFGSFT